jgi:hypothetical protein
MRRSALACGVFRVLHELAELRRMSAHFSSRARAMSPSSEPCCSTETLAAALTPLLLSAVHHWVHVKAHLER